MHRLEKQAARREHARMEELKKLLSPEDYELIVGTEGVGLLGDTIPVLNKDWQLYQDAQLIVRSLLRTNTPREIRPFIDRLRKMRTAIVARSFRSDVIRHMFGEFKEELGGTELPVAGEGEAKRK